MKCRRPAGNVGASRGGRWQGLLAAAAAADRQLSPPPPHWSLQPPAERDWLVCLPDVGTLHSQTSEAAPYELCDVEDSVPISSTSEAAPYELCDVEDSVPLSPTSEAAPYEL